MMNESIQTLDKYEQAQAFLKGIANQLPLKNKRSNIDQIIKLFSKQLIENHICVIIAVHHSGNLLPLIEAAQIKLKDDKHKEVDLWLSQVYRLGYECFFSKHQTYSKLFQSIKNRYQQKNKKGLYSELQEVAKNRHQMFSAYLKQYFDLIKSKQQPRPKIKQLQLFINEKVMQIIPNNPFEQIFVGWLKYQLGITQSSMFQQLKIPADCMCCRLLFFKDQTLESQEANNVRYVSGSQKARFNTQHQFFKKIGISFLNFFGGTIYLGVFCEAKKVNIGGVLLSQIQKQELVLTFFDQLTINILPYETELNMKNTKEETKAELTNYRQKKLMKFKKQLATPKNQYILNEFISLEFINIHENDTLLLSRQTVAAYVVKINIRPGNQFNLYHLINEKDTPEAYLWDGKKQKRLTFPEFYEEVYRRLKAKANKKKYDKGESPVHQFCRSFRPIPSQLQN